jgi:hypothetical protein
VGRRGKKKALIAVGHKIIVASYHIIKNKEGYKEPTLNNNPRNKNRQIRNYLNRLKDLGIENSILELMQQTIKGPFLTESNKYLENEID